MADCWPFWRRYLNLAQPRLGASISSVSDEFFGAAERLIDPAEPVFVPGKYDEHGKWMDGWESRRRRDDGHDWVVVELDAPSRLFGFDIDTSHFNGNHPQAVAIEAATSAAPDNWFEFLPRVETGPDQQHLHEVQHTEPVTRLRLNIFPDGGVARLRAYGVVEHDWTVRAAQQEAEGAGELIDLAAVGNGGCVLAASDEHFGIASNLLLPGRGIHMGDGWETARRRGPGHDWAVIALGCPGSVEQIEIDTAHFKGNFPHECALEAGFFPTGADPLSAGDSGWVETVARSRLSADLQHHFIAGLAPDATFSHVRLCTFPDGGVSRLRILGQPRPMLPAPTT